MEYEQYISLKFNFIMIYQPSVDSDVCFYCGYLIKTICCELLTEF